MPKVKISEFSSTPANNTDIDSINIAEGCAPSGINDAIRELMAQLKDFQVGSAGDPVTVGGVLTVQAGAVGTPAITTAGDTNTGIFFPAADTIAFAEGGAEAMRLDSSGNMGLGTTSPSGRLHVANTGTAGTTADNLAVYFTSTNRNSNVYIRAKNTEGSVLNFADGDSDVVGRIAYEHSDNTMRFDASGSEQMRLNSTGLGIGTSSPVLKLDVRSGATPTAALLDTTAATAYSAGSFFTGANLQLRSAANATGNGAGIRFSSSNNGSLEGMFGWVQNASTYGDFVWQGYNGSYVERMRLDSSGNLGIGTTSPSDTSSYGRALDIQSSTGAAIYLRDSDGPTTHYGFVAYDSSIDSLTLGSITASTGIMRLLTAGSERARIDSSGNLLVGTTTTSLSSSVNGFVVNSTGTINAYRAGGVVGYFNRNTNDGTILSFRTSDVERGSVSISGSVTSYNTTSDQRLKENIQDADSASSLIDALQVRKFDWKANGSHQRYGFVAQELVTVAPEAVHQPEDTEQMMAVDYSKLVPMLVKEIQSLRKRLADAGI